MKHKSNTFVIFCVIKYYPIVDKKYHHSQVVNQKVSETVFENSIEKNNRYAIINRERTRYHYILFPLAP